MDEDGQNLIPIVVIIGSTGVGKTKLSIDLAQSLNGEIIGADSMQIYRGLDAGAAKPTSAELAAIPHHLIGTLPPTSACDVHHYVSLADTAIQSIHQRGRVPIICGGTYYWLEQLLFETLVTQSATKATTSSPQPDTWPPLSLDIASADIHEPMSSAIAEWALKQRTAFPSPIDFQKHLRALSDDKLYEELRAIDPHRAQHVKGQNRRLRRALEWAAETGVQHSAAHKHSGGRAGTRLRYRAAMLWVWADGSVVEMRCANRLKDMVRIGVVSEVWELSRLWTARIRAGLPYLENVNAAYGAITHDDLSSEVTTIVKDDDMSRVDVWPWNQVDCSIGLAQAIGFKEFLPWVERLQSQCFLMDDWLRKTLLGESGKTENPGVISFPTPNKQIVNQEDDQHQLLKDLDENVLQDDESTDILAQPQEAPFPPWPCRCQLRELCKECRYPEEGPVCAAARALVGKHELVVTVLQEMSTIGTKKVDDDKNDKSAWNRFQNELCNEAMVQTKLFYPTMASERTTSAVQDACARIQWHWSILSSCVSTLAVNTHRYARGQAKWITQRLLKVAREWAPQHDVKSDDDYGKDDLLKVSQDKTEDTPRTAISSPEKSGNQDLRHEIFPDCSKWDLLMVRADSSMIGTAGRHPPTQSTPTNTKKGKKAVLSPLLTPQELAAARAYTASQQSCPASNELYTASNELSIASNASSACDCVCLPQLSGEWRTDVLQPMLSAVHAFLGLPHVHTHAHHDTHSHGDGDKHSDGEKHGEAEKQLLRGCSSSHLSDGITATSQSIEPLVRLPKACQSVPNCLIPFLLIPRLSQEKQHKDQLLSSSSSSSKLSTSTEAADTPKDTHQHIYCDVCSRTIAGAHNWAAHVASKAHKSLAKRGNRKREREEDEISVNVTDMSGPNEGTENPPHKKK